MIKKFAGLLFMFLAMALFSSSAQASNTDMGFGFGGEPVSQFVVVSSGHLNIDGVLGYMPILYKFNDSYPDWSISARDNTMEKGSSVAPSLGVLAYRSRTGPTDISRTYTVLAGIDYLPDIKVAG